MTGLKKRIICAGLLLALAPHALAVDRVITRQNKKYEGTFQSRSKDGLVFRTVDGTIVVLPQNEISKIYREDKSIWDFETGTRYYLKKSRPFLPFTLLGLAAGAYAVSEFGKFQDERDRVQAETPDGVDNTTDKSMTHMALSIASGLFAAGCFYFAFRPMEVKIPLGRINLSATSRGITLALHF